MHLTNVLFKYPKVAYTFIQKQPQYQRPNFVLELKHAIFIKISRSHLANQGDRVWLKVFQE